MSFNHTIGTVSGVSGVSGGRVHSEGHSEGCNAGGWNIVITLH